MKKKIIVIFSFLIFLMAIGAVSAHDLNDSNDTALTDTLMVSNEDMSNENIEITNSDELKSNNNIYLNGSASSSGDGSQARPFTTFIEAYNAANDGDTIYIASGTYSGYKTNNEIKIVKQIHITTYGKDPVIFDGSGKYTIFLIDAPNVEINGITFDSKAYYESVILWLGDGNNGLLTNCIFINSQSENACALKVCGNGCNVINCTFINCSATNGGAIHWDGSYGNIINSTFINCSASEIGGAIKWYSAYGNLINSTFINCSASKIGGAIYLESYVNLNSLIFINCSAGIYGNAIFYLFNKNYVSLTIENSIFLNNYGSTYDIGLNKTGEVYSRNNWFGNTYDDRSVEPTKIEGPIENTWLYLANEEDLSDLNVGDSRTINYYLYKSDDGTVYNSSDFPTLSFDVSSKHGSTNASKINLKNGHASVRYTSISNFNDLTISYYTVNITLSHNDIYVNASAKSAGDGSKFHPFKTFKQAYEAASNGDTIHIASGTYTGNDNIQITIEKSLHIIGYGSNPVVFDGANEFWIFKVRQLDVEINGITFVNARHYRDSCIILEFPASRCNITNCVFKDCSALYGGALYMNLNDCLIINTSFINCTAKDGGALYCGGEGNGIINSTFINCHADRDGGAIYWGKQATFKSSIFINNSADRRGNAIFSFNQIWVSELTIEDCIILDNCSSGNVFYVVNSGGLISRNNWFGNIYDNRDEGPNINKVNENSWLYLDNIEDLTDLNIGDSRTINYYLFKYEGLEHDLIYNASDMPALTFDVSSDYGSANVSKINLEKGHASVLYTSLNERNDLTISNSTFSYNIFNSFDYNLTATNTIVDGKSTISVELPFNAGGNVSVAVSLNGSEKFKFNITVNPATGKGSYDITLNEGGKYDVHAYYEGDNPFISKENNASFNVSKFDSQLTLTVDDIDAGNNCDIKATVLKDAMTGSVTFIIEDIGEFTVDLIDKIAVLNNVTINKKGIFTVTAIYNGNSRYNPSNETKTFIAEGLNCEVNLTVTDIRVDDNVNIKATLSNDTITGNVTFIIENIGEFTVELTDGVAELNNITITKNGTYTVTAIYNGNSMYNPSNDTRAFNVSKVDSSILFIYAADIKVDDNVYIAAAISLNNLSGNVTFVIENIGEYTLDVEPLYTLLNNVTISKEGTYAVNITYNGNYKYNPSTGSSTFKVTKRDPNLNLTVTDIKVDDKIDIKASFSDDNTTGNVTFIIENIGEYTVELTDGVAELNNITISKNGTYTVTAIYDGNYKYNPSNDTKAFNVTKYDLGYVSVYAANIKVDENVYIGVGIFDDVSGNVTFAIENIGEYTVKKDSMIVTLDNVTISKEGTYAVNITYNGNYKYNPYNTSSTFNVSKYDSRLNLTVTDIKVDDNLDIKAQIIVSNDNLTGNVTFTIENIGEFTVELTDGVAVLNNITITKNGTYVVNATYNGNYKYLISNASSTFNTDKYDSRLNLTVTDIKVDDNLDIKAHIIVSKDNLTGNVTFNIENIGEFTVELTDGVAVLNNITITKNGTYTVNAVYNGNYKYLTSNSSADFIVSKIAPEITVENPVLIQSDDLIVLIDNDAEGLVILTVNGQEFNATPSEGKAVFETKDIPYGNYTATINFLGDDKYENSSLTANITLIINLVVDAPDLIKYYGGDENFTVTVRDAKNNTVEGKLVFITINGQTYNRTTDDDGNAYMAINLVPNSYAITVQVEEIIVNSSATVLTTVNGTDILKVYRNATQYFATFRDGEGNYLSNGTTVRFNINGVFYDRQVSENGLAKLNINLVTGTYILTAYNPVTGEESSNIITVVPQIIENQNLVKYYQNDSQYVVKVTDVEGNVVGEGEKVTFNINGVMYERYTNKTGHARLNINLNPGEYIVTAMYNSSLASNNITVLSQINTTDLTKKYGSEDAFKAKVFDKTGKIAVGATVQFNINGVLYNRTSDSEGIASLNINLVVGKYIITSIYDGFTTGNTVTVTD